MQRRCFRVLPNCKPSRAGGGGGRGSSASWTEVKKSPLPKAVSGKMWNPDIKVHKRCREEARKDSKYKYRKFSFNVF